MKKLFYIILLAVLFACGRAGVDPQTDPSNWDAINNIIRYDIPSVFNLNQFDFSIPDTSQILPLSFKPLYWWRTIQRDSSDVFILISEPGANDTSGSVPRGNVVITKYFWGTLEVIAVDTSGEVWHQVRLSKPFDMKGTITALFEKIGSDYNSRRGWRLTQLSDAVYTPKVQGQALPQPRIDLYASGSFIRIDPARKYLKNLPQFALGESVTVSILMNDTTNIIRMRYPYGYGYATRELSHIGGTYTGGFTFTRNENYGHLLIDAIAGSAVSDTVRYRPNAIGVVYRIR
jgi:hypothetical protein